LKEKEPKNNQEQQNEISEIFLDVNMHLENLTDLTCSHMKYRSLPFVHSLRRNENAIVTISPECKTQKLYEKPIRHEPVTQDEKNFSRTKESKSSIYPERNAEYQSFRINTENLIEPKKDFPFIDDDVPQTDLELYEILNGTLDFGLSVQKIQLSS